MPIYEYQCANCNYKYEKKEGFEAPTEHACPRCGATARRVFRPPIIVFKGPGFYSTDNKREGWSRSTSSSENGSDSSADSTESVGSVEPAAET